MMISDVFRSELRLLGRILRFQQPLVEAEYRAYATRRVYSTVQVMMSLAVVTFAVFGGFDVTGRNGGIDSTRFRYMIVCPILTGFLALTFSSAAKKHWRFLVVCYCIVGVMSIYGIVLLLDRESIFPITAGSATVNYSLSLAFVALVPLPPLYVLSVALLAQVAHAHIVWCTAHLSSTLAAFYTFHELCLSSVVFWISVEREDLLRREFLRFRTVSEERDDLRTELLSFTSMDAISRARRTGRPVADAYGEVTVVFCDIVNFTRLAERLAPRHLVEVLNEIFSDLDLIAGSCHVEKVKTIGDAYMAISGTSEDNRSSAVDAAEFALGVATASEKLSQKLGTSISFRIGMHTGSIIGGVVGRQKLAYDYWGRTVNLASRLEHNCLPGEIRVSEATCLRLGPYYVLEPAGSTDLKGIGILETFVLKGRTTEKHYKPSV